MEACMKTRPVGITVLSISSWVGVAWMALLTGLSVWRPETHAALLRSLSPGGSGPADVHLGMGRLLPLYYLAMTAASAALALALWRLRNWARLVVLATVGLSLVGLIASTTRLGRGASAGAWALFLVRIGLCFWVGSYLMSRRVRAAFRTARPSPAPMSRRPLGLEIADRALEFVGLVLLGLGVTAWPLLVPLGWTALVLAFFSWVAEADGIAVPRPGRAHIKCWGCGETPLAFGVRHRNRAMLFIREEKAPGGGWSDAYTVCERPGDPGVDPRFELPLAPGSEWSARGQVPVASLAFEHHERVSYVQSASLDWALGAAGI
jgi:hypothetical protein